LTNTKKAHFDNTIGLKTYPKRLSGVCIRIGLIVLGHELYISKEDPLEYFWSLWYLLRSFNEGTCKTRQEARNAAIEKLNQLINEG
jgi:hypothetical protein